MEIDNIVFIDTPLGEKIFEKDFDSLRDELAEFLSVKEKYLMTGERDDLYKMKSLFLKTHSLIKGLESEHCISHYEHMCLLDFLRKGV